MEGSFPLNRFKADFGRQSPHRPKPKFSVGIRVAVLSSPRPYATWRRSLSLRNCAKIIGVCTLAINLSLFFFLTIFILRGGAIFNRPALLFCLIVAPFVRRHHCHFDCSRLFSIVISTVAVFFLLSFRPSPPKAGAWRNLRERSQTPFGGFLCCARCRSLRS